VWPFSADRFFCGSKICKGMLKARRCEGAAFLSHRASGGRTWNVDSDYDLRGGISKGGGQDYSKGF